MILAWQKHNIQNWITFFPKDIELNVINNIIKDKIEHLSDQFDTGLALKNLKQN